MGIELVKVSWSDAWDTLKIVGIIILFYGASGLTLKRIGSKYFNPKLMLIFIKVLIIAALIFFTLFIGIDSKGHVTILNWPPKYITLIQLFLLPLLFIDLVGGILDLIPFKENKKL